MDFSLLLDHWPFAVMALIFWVCGHFFARSVFTGKRAQRPGKMQWFWWWGRESLELHPILAGALVGLLWVDPEGADWGRVESVAYFAGAGASSLFLWVLMSNLLEKMGVDSGALRMPGESKPPEAP
jgi:hypothetical protein